MISSTTPSLALLTDLYELTMAHGYWRLGRHEDDAAFHLFFRKTPFGGGYAIAAGLGEAIDYLRRFRFEPDDLEYLAGLRGNDDQALLGPKFLEALADMRFSCDVDAIPEGTVVFAHEPLVRVTGPIWQCQMLESALLNMINFQTLIATKAARVTAATQGDPVIEFGMRRAQGIDGALAATRASYIGGCAGTSNVLAGKLLGIPVKGTHAHSWVMSFDDEPGAFDAYVEVLPNNCIFLVDTYDTLDGVRHAIEAGRRLRDRGHEMIGVRLDSGDLAYLSIEARRMLDDAGFPEAKIVASNDLDERLITSLKQQGAKIDIWGVGTRLVTAYDQPALGGVYKLTAIRRAGEPWQPKIKLSEQSAKVNTPGILQVRRFTNNDRFVGDAIYDEQIGLELPTEIVDPADPLRRKRLASGVVSEDLLRPIFRRGECIYDEPSLPAMQARTRAQLQALHPTIRRFDHPHAYPAGLEARLHEHKLRMIDAARSHVSKQGDA